MGSGLGGGGSWDNNGGTQAFGGSVLIGGNLRYVGGYANYCTYDPTTRNLISYVSGTPPVANTGSGGGGGGSFSSTGTNGSDGIVIIQF